MASILICSTPFHGHVTPLLAVARHFISHGDRVRFLTGSHYRDTVQSTGAEFVPLPPDADRDEIYMANTSSDRKRLTGAAALRQGIIDPFINPLPLQMTAVAELLDQEHTDAVLAEGLFAGLVALLQVPRDERPLVVYLGVVPLPFRSRDTAPFGLGITPMPGPVGRLRNAVLQVIADRVMFAPVEKHAKDVVAIALGRSFEGSMLEVAVRADVFAQFSVQGFEYPRSDLPDSVHFVGPVSRVSSSATPLPSWWSDLDGSHPVIHVTQGTVANTDYTELIQPTIDGLAGEDVLVVVSTGGRPVDSVAGPLPSNVRVASFLPYDQLLPKIDVMVTNGGYGGVHFALEHGIPIVVAGQTEDKTEVSARVGWSGTGINLRTSQPRPRAIAKAVRRVLADPRYRESSMRIRDEIAASPGVAGLAELVHAHSAIS